MGIRLIIEGNAAYEIDEDCLACQQEDDRKGREEKKRIETGQRREEENEQESM